MSFRYILNARFTERYTRLMTSLMTHVKCQLSVPSVLKHEDNIASIKIQRHLKKTFTNLSQFLRVELKTKNKNCTVINDLAFHCIC